MNNIGHYIKGIRSGESYFTLEKKFSFISYVLAAFHLYLCVLFYTIKIYPLMVYCAFSIFFFLVLVKKLVKKHHFASAMVISIFEISLCSIAATLCVGMDAGFAAYNIAMITASFYLAFVIESFQNKEIIPFLFSLISMACYILDYVMMLFVKPLYPLPSEQWTHVLYLSNHVISFVMMIVFSFLFIWEIRSSQDTLATQNKKLDELAHRDPLTQLLNRRSMTEHLQKSMEILKKTGKRFSIILCDIDDFKKVNDTYGHDAGDLVLKTVADIISQGVRDGDKVCRWGGEEVLILINDPVETASTAAERIRKRIEENVTTYEGEPIRITMTFGVTESIPGFRIEHLIQQADDKLYEGKKSGKNTVVV